MTAWFNRFRRRHWQLQYLLCMCGLHLWEHCQFFDWCDCCQTPRHR